MSHLWHLLLLSLLLWAVHPLLTYREKSIYVAKNYPIFITSYFPSNLILISYLYGMMVQILHQEQDTTSTLIRLIYKHRIFLSAAQRCMRCETNQADTWHWRELSQLGRRLKSLKLRWVWRSKVEFGENCSVGWCQLFMKHRLLRSIWNASVVLVKKFFEAFLT